MRSAVLAIALAGCASAAASPVAEHRADSQPDTKTTPVVQVAAAVVEPAASPARIAEPVEYDSWAGFGVASCSYLAPTNPVNADGSVDVVWHFHAGQMAARDMKASNARAVFVSCGYGIGTGGYSSHFDDPNAFGSMMKRLTATIARKAGRSDVHLGHLALASWSAGFAAVNRILGVPEWYEKTDAVLLFDSLHAQYIDSEQDAKLKAAGRSLPSVAQRGADHVDTNMLRRFIRFATDAAAGQKTMVITHSAIVPPDYASTTEATAALLNAVGVAPKQIRTTEIGASEFSNGAMAPAIFADAGNLHVRGFRGYGPHDHFDHLHLIGDAVRTWIVPAWYSSASERH